MDMVVDNDEQSQWGQFSKVPVSVEGDQKSWALTMPGELNKDDHVWKPCKSLWLKFWINCLWSLYHLLVEHKGRDADYIQMHKSLISIGDSPKTASKKVKRDYLHTILSYVHPQEDDLDEKQIWQWTWLRGKGNMWSSRRVREICVKSENMLKYFVAMAWQE